MISLIFISLNRTSNRKILVKNEWKLYNKKNIPPFLLNILISYLTNTNPSPSPQNINIYNIFNENYGIFVKNGQIYGSTFPEHFSAKFRLERHHFFVEQNFMQKRPNFDPLWVLPTLSFFVCISVVPNFLFFKHERKKIQVHNTSVPIWCMINKESFFKRRPWDFVAKFWMNKTEKLKFANLCRNLRLDYY